jgi:RNA polymerase sigma factor (sigma-70 family)
MPDEDAVFLTRAAKGDAAALRTLLERCGPQVWSEIDRDIGRRWQYVLEADDVMQVTYMEAFLQVEQLAARDTAAFVAWLRRIAQNNLRDAIKELERKKRPDPARRVHAPAGDESYVALVDLLGETTTTPSRHVAAGEAGRIVREMLDRLPADYATVIRMYDLEGRSAPDVAAAMGRSPGAVHMLRARAHDRLRSLLGAETNFFSRTA